jgi:N6-L-threonylcarbamoyladenine synthase
MNCYSIPVTILSIETSCDETGVSVLEGADQTLRILGNALASQVDLHAKYGGVFPAMAKRAHAEKIVTLLQETLEQAGMLTEGGISVSDETKQEIRTLCSHEEGLSDKIIAFVETYAVPNIEHIAVTAGPGLEPALWVGINTAQAFGMLWNKPVHPINHMEGHVVSALLKQKDPNAYAIHELSYSALSLLVSGGHTELVLMQKPLSYEKIGHTQDDAVGEAFDKVARILGLPYPGGPKISALAAEARAEGIKPKFTLPRPMLHTANYNFSYSGLKTAVLYLVRDMQKENPDVLNDETIKKMIALEFENAAIEVLVSKTIRAVQEYGVQTLVIGGGVAANNYLREQIKEKIETRFGITVLFPTKELSTDNSVMIGMVLYYHLLHGKEKTVSSFKADGNLSISQ